MQAIIPFFSAQYSICIYVYIHWFFSFMRQNSSGLEIKTRKKSIQLMASGNGNHMYIESETRNKIGLEYYICSLMSHYSRMQN